MIINIERNLLVRSDIGDWVSDGVYGMGGGGGGRVTRNHGLDIEFYVINAE